MERVEKELLMNDLCARLPFCVFVQDSNKETVKLEISNNDFISMVTGNDDGKICRPYLRPFTSITEDEIKEWMVMKYGKNDICVRNLISCKSRKYDTSCTVEISWYSDLDDDECAQYEDYKPKSSTIFTISSDNVSINFIDWLNEHHFDYRGLIRKGLAFEAPEGMYFSIA